jgi:small-conductance mechanosensitive channel
MSDNNSVFDKELKISFVLKFVFLIILYPPVLNFIFEVSLIDFFEQGFNQKKLSIVVFSSYLFITLWMEIKTTVSQRVKNTILLILPVFYLFSLSLFLIDGWERWWPFLITILFFLSASYVNYKKRIKKSIAIWSHITDYFVVVVLSLMLINVSEFQDNNYITLSYFIFFYFIFGHFLDSILKALFNRYIRNREIDKDKLKDKYKGLVIKENKPSFIKQKFKYLIGNREEVDKEIALIFVSLFFLGATIAEYQPKYTVNYTDPNSITLQTSNQVSDRFVSSLFPHQAIGRVIGKGAEKKSINSTTINTEKKFTVKQKFFKAIKNEHRYYFTLLILSISLLTLSLIKFNFRFDHEEEDPKTTNGNNSLDKNAEYSRTYTCSHSIYEKIVKEYESEDGKDKADLEVYNAYYELYRQYGKESCLKNSIPEDYFDCSKKNDLSDIKNELCYKGFNDYAVNKLDSNNEGHVNKEPVKELIVAAEQLPSATYNICVFLIKLKFSSNNDEIKEIIKYLGLEHIAESKDIDDIIEYYIIKGDSFGHIRCHNLKINWSQNNEDYLTDLKYERIADYPSGSALLRAKKHQKPAEMLISTSRIIALILVSYLLMVTFKHPQSGSVGMGLGAFGVFGFGLSFIFKPSIQSFFAGIKIYKGDFARIGDRIESKELNLRGRISGFTLTNVKVTNTDNSTSNIELDKFTRANVLNWRKLSNTEGRRLRKNLLIDINSIKKWSKHTNKLFKNIEKLEKMKGFILCKESDFKKPLELNKEEFERYPDHRFITNLGLFRAYVGIYLNQHDFIDGSKAITILEKDVTPEGLPIEINAYTMPSDEFTEFTVFNHFQSDIIEHIISVAGFFEIEFFQYPIGYAKKDT